MIEYSQKIIDKAIKGEQKRGRVTRKRIEEKHLRNKRKKGPPFLQHIRNKNHSKQLWQAKGCVYRLTLFTRKCRLEKYSLIITSRSITGYNFESHQKVDPLWPKVGKKR